MSFLCEKGRAATFCLLLCAYRFKKGSASLVFELDDYETAEAAAASSFSVFVPGSSTSPSRDFALLTKSTYIKVLLDKTPFSTSTFDH